MSRKLVCTVVDMNKWYDIWKCHSCGYEWDYSELQEFYSVFEPKLTKKGNISLRCPECFIRGKIRPVKYLSVKKYCGVTYDKEDMPEDMNCEEFF